MFNTLRAKISAIAVSMLVALMFAVSFYVFIYLKNSKNLLIWSYSHSITVFAQNINKEIIKIEDNAKDLALLGSMYYKTGRNFEILNRAMLELFKNYPSALGGGVWFKPYTVSKDQKFYSTYVYKDKKRGLIRDESFNSKEYDYFNQNWYKQILTKLETASTAWSSPYYENSGSKTLMITSGAGIYDSNNNLIGISTVDWEIEKILTQVSNMKPTQNSFALFADKNNDYILVSTDKYLDNKNLVGKPLKNIPWYNDNLKNVTYFTYHNQKFLPYVKNLDNNMILIICVPKSEIFYPIVVRVAILFIVLILINLIISAILYTVLKKDIVIPIEKLTSIANKIGHGEDIEIKIKSPEEFANLASTFNKMTKNIKETAKEKERINSELSVAQSIQKSSLPSVFPPYPDIKEFDIFASMTPAKEIGGDFYDFYFIDENNFMFYIADVSGKSIPAALFMMKAKTLISSLATKEAVSYEKLIKDINNKICKNNAQGLFITLLAVIVNIKTGKTTFINCGHNNPLVKKGESFEYVKLPSNLVLGAFEDLDFEISEINLSKGGEIFLYTDGITEAENQAGVMYGEDGLYNLINGEKGKDLEITANNIKKDVVNYMDKAPQSDDLTMVLFKYNGNYREENFFDIASLENYKKFYGWLYENCKKWGLNEDITNKIGMCAEEIFANITFYSYKNSPQNGNISAILRNEKEKITLQFEDWGLEYNPLEKPDPDITLPPEQRPLGGLGIFMVKTMCDNVTYNRISDKNSLVLEFKK